MESSESSAVVLGALIVGVLCGLAPLIFGLVRKQGALAVGGFVACIAGGFVLGIILALPLAILFCWLIWRADRRRTGTATAAPATGTTRFERPSADRPAQRETAGRM